MTTSLLICATFCAGSLLGSEYNIGWLHWYGVVCWALLWPILLGSAGPHKVHGALAPSVQPIKILSVYHLHAPPPDRSVPLQWLAPQFGICQYAHSLELFLRHSFLNLRQFYLIMLGLGAPLGDSMSDQPDPPTFNFRFFLKFVHTFVHHTEAQNQNFIKIFQTMTEICLRKVGWGKRKFVPNFATLSLSTYSTWNNSRSRAARGMRFSLLY